MYPLWSSTQTRQRQTTLTSTQGAWTQTDLVCFCIAEPTQTRTLHGWPSSSLAFRIPWRDESERGPAEWDEHDACRVRRAVQIKTSRSSVAGCGADVRVRIRDGLRVQRCDGRLRYLRRQRLARPSRPSGRMDRRSVTSAESYTPHTSRKTNALLSYTTPEAPVPEASFLSCPTRLFSLM